ncbi:MAG: cation diffusion facilitator family transporter [Woeseiaceae bacterium]|nr:cation diffusion facilitator family transporter [Woeseiaceae bacterium]
MLRCLLLEGAANVAVLLLKLVVGLSTQSMAILADALHSLTDIANNVIAWFVVRASGQPADREHPYGHQKFEILAVFVLGVLLATIGLEIATRALTRSGEAPATSAWGLALMITVLVVNILISSWQRYWARRLDSKILAADASHTFADVLTTVVVIAGWQLSARGWPWLDTLCALGVAAMIFRLAFGLFRDALPALVDEYAIAPEKLTAVVREVPGVQSVRRVRSRWIGSERLVDVVVTVQAALSTVESHRIADAIEEALESEFDVTDVTVHVEPHRVGRGMRRGENSG